MINITNPADCCGCTACASVCAHDAIMMHPDALGFLYPKVDTAKCTDCGLCEKVCAFNDNYDKHLNLRSPLAFGARHKDINEVETSRSGATFIAISDYILAQGGVVYGVGYEDHFRVCHKRATTKEERDEFKGSKYVQSDLTGIFRQVKQDLKDGLLVFFSGTPCQTSGLNSYIGKHLRKNLLLVDVVCHGVSSPYVWRDYLEHIEDKQKDTLLKVNFRDKQLFGWNLHRESCIFKSNPNETVTFQATFYNKLHFRHSCHNCHFCNTIRPSDITIADFWGWEKTNPEINADDKGVNLILVNTEKGLQTFHAIREHLNVFDAELANSLQPNLQAPTAIHPKRIQFEQDYINRGFAYVSNKYKKKTPLKLRAKAFLRRLYTKITSQ